MDERRRTSRPVSRVLCPALAHRVAAIHLGLPSPTGSSGLPAGSGGPPSVTCANPLVSQGILLDLAPGGVYLAAPVTRNAGGLLHHRFTLTGQWPAVCFLWHCPASHPGLPLTTTLPCGARTFLGEPVSGFDATARSARPPQPRCYRVDSLDR